MCSELFMDFEERMGREARLLLYNVVISFEREYGV